MPTIDGWMLIHDNLRRWSRTVKSDGVCTPEAIADACGEAQSQIVAIAIESGVPWTVKNISIADSALGTTVGYQRRRFFIEEDLGITDLAKVRSIWRIDSNNQSPGWPIHHFDNEGTEAERSQNLLTVSSIGGREMWTESGDANSDGNPEQTILLYNWGANATGYNLSIEYWYNPPLVTVDDFTAIDASGNSTARPSLPRAAWPALQAYAKLVLLETMGDDYKANAMWRRYNSPAGILEQLRNQFSSFQTGESTFVQPMADEEVG